MGPLFSTKTGRNIKTNAEVLSKMRYLTSLVVFQMTAVGGLARVAQKSMKLCGNFDIHFRPFLACIVCISHVFCVAPRLCYAT